MLKRCVIWSVRTLMRFGLLTVGNPFHPHGFHLLFQGQLLLGGKFRGVVHGYPLKSGWVPDVVKVPAKVWTRQSSGNFMHFGIVIGGMGNPF